MKNVRHGVTILALAFTVGTVGACAGSRAEPDWRPRTSRGAASGKGKTEVKRDDRRKRRNDDNGRRRGQDRRGNEERGNNGNGKGKGKP
jgi:hypothetical protein